jgi:hypothetical protein
VSPTLRCRPVAGARLEPIGNQWVAWSPLSGETQLLNDESAAVLEATLALGECDTATVCRWLSDGQPDTDPALEALVDMTWVPLMIAGLVRRVGTAD